jgi:hypothetical protein
VAKKFHRLPQDYDYPRLKQCGFWWAFDMYGGRKKGERKKRNSEERTFMDKIVDDILKKKKK